jgi:hypothetical protein
MVEAARVELIAVLTARKLLIPGSATTAKKAPLPEPFVGLLYEKHLPHGRESEALHELGIPQVRQIG